MAITQDIPNVTITAGEALAANRLVQRDGTYADAGDRPAVGATIEAIANGADGPVRMPAAGTMKAEAAGAIVDGVEVVSAADGKVQTITGLGAGTYYLRGIAMEAASGDGSIIEIMPHNWGAALVVT